AKQIQKCQEKRGRAARKAAMNLVDDGLDEIKNQSDQLEARILEQDRRTDKHTRRPILPLRVGWAPARHPAPSFKSDLSVIAASAKLIVFISVVAILYFGRPVFVPLAVAILLTFILAPFVRVLRRWHLGRIPSIIAVVFLAFLTLFGLGMVLGQQVKHLAADLPKYEDTLTKKIDALRGAAAGTGTLGQASNVLRNLGQELDNARPGLQPLGVTQSVLSPIQVEIHQPAPAPLEVIQKIINPLLDP